MLYFADAPRTLSNLFAPARVRGKTVLVQQHHDSCSANLANAHHAFDGYGRCECGTERSIEFHGSGRSWLDKVPDRIWTGED